MVPYCDTLNQYVDQQHLIILCFAFTVKPRNLVGATFLKFLAGSVTLLPSQFVILVFLNLEEDQGELKL